MAEHEIWVPYRPKVKGRPRLGRRGRVFTPEATLEAEAMVAGHWSGPIFDGPVEVEVEYHSDGQRVVVREVEDKVRPKYLSGDLDNYVKLTLDALNTVAFTDDKLVQHLAARFVKSP